MGLSSQDMVAPKRINSRFQLLSMSRRRRLHDVDFGVVVISKQTVNSGVRCQEVMKKIICNLG